MPFAETNATHEVERGLRTIVANPNADGLAQACVTATR